MPISIPMKPGFMYWGVTLDLLDLEVPFLQVALLKLQEKYKHKNRPMDLSLHKSLEEVEINKH